MYGELECYHRTYHSDQDPGPTATPEVGEFEQAFKDLGGYDGRMQVVVCYSCSPFSRIDLSSRSAASLLLHVSHLVTIMPAILSCCEDSLTLPISASTYLSNSSLSLSNLIGSSQTVKARLLHYFPPSPENPLPAEDEAIDSWCGFHLDHSLLTGLCSVCLPLKFS